MRICAKKEKKGGNCTICDDIKHGQKKKQPNKQTEQKQTRNKIVPFNVLLSYEDFTLLRTH